MDLNQARPRINASMLAAHLGQAVSILGLASNIDSAGMSFQLKTSDNQQVQVMMEEPIQEYLNGLVEVHGTVDNQNRVRANHYINLMDSTNTFDMASYDKAVQFIHQFPTHYVTADSPQ